MDFLRQKAEQGFSLRRINCVMEALSLLISALFLLTAYQISGSYDALIDATEEYNDQRGNAYTLQDASDYLSLQAQTYAMTGKRAALEGYFREATVARRREEALARFKGRGEPSRAYQDLERAMEESLELMETEYASMRLAAEAMGEDPESLPEEVRTASLPEEAQAMSAQERLHLARSLVFDENYRAQKDRISRDMNACLNDLMQQMTLRQLGAQEELSRLIDRLRVLVGLLIVVVVLHFLASSRLVLGPLLTGVGYIREGQELPVRGAYEFRFLARTYNRMFRENQKRTERLTFEAKHDKLTGAYNRSGYDALMERTDLSDSALLLVDVDKFKTVNDTYGHQTGDQALVRVAEALRSSFVSDESEDFVCRIGGDEFAVLLTGAGPESRGWIERKINQINRRLRQEKSDSWPALSISVGCAFGGAPRTSGALDKDADIALYQVKENGRCGCAFYQ